MSINSAMLAGVSGLVANSSALAAISDNIANVNTVAYKRNQVNFANIVTAQAVTGRYSAGGVQGISRQYVSQQGLIQSATSPTDLALDGDGFFVVTDKGANLTAADARKFTRSGSFHVDSNGYLVNDAGLYLQGWLAQTNGSFDVDPSDLTKMNSINVKNQGAAVSQTTNVVVTANVNKNQTLNPAVLAAPVPPVPYSATTAGSMADYSKDPTTGTKPDLEIPMSVIDSQGGSHQLVLGLLKSAANPNEWYAELYSSPDTDITGGPGRPGQVKTGLVKFNPDGSINLSTSTIFGGSATPSIAIGNSATGAAPKWATSLGLDDQTVSFDLNKLTQYAATSAVDSVNSDGASVGNITGVRVDEDGFVSVLYDNSEVRKIAQIGIATFPNPDALRSVSGNAYQATLPSGEFTIKQAGVSGAGHVSPSTLEASTVDLSAEFTGLITTQRAYSASSKIITTADQMLEELLNIKR